MQRFAKVFCKKRFAGVARVESSQGAEFARLVEAGARVAVLFCKACVCVGVARLAVFARVCEVARVAAVFARLLWKLRS